MIERWRGREMRVRRLVSETAGMSFCILNRDFLPLPKSKILLLRIKECMGGSQNLDNNYQRFWHEMFIHSYDGLREDRI